ncbi:unnamed protein product [Bursaphelenchus okinawaensis]|uniref:Zinc transporter ZIP11 n=1 Tax=Bursaphelenchus okinawaensis TaxID=465554 RepID=A0A811JTM6_9BILA|nr:unnamed protein product [Bursaphelenchus okinawaensis]CAG9082523.1 unnamed protein product [Bursaphelenchus okinawaensis]
MIANADPRLQALLASLFTWGVTALGAALVFVLPANNKTFLDISLGFAAGVMTAASFWSLLAPAIEISEATMGAWAFVPVALGFALGALFVHLSDKLIPSCVGAELSIISVITNDCGENDGIMLEQPTNTQDINRVTADPESKMLPQHEREQKEKIEKERVLSWRRILLLIMAVTVHNIPEGLAVGVGFASVGKTPVATFEKAFNLALGIGLQNFPEGLAVSLPLAGFGVGKFKSFLCGQFSGMVEPLAAVFGAYALILMEPALPYALSFAAGAMIYVVFDDIIPEAQRNENGKMASCGAIIGFLVMMCMDVGLG